LKSSSYDTLEATALRQVIPRIGAIMLSEITPEDIGSMLTEMKDKGLSYSTVKKVFDCVNAVLTYAFNKRDITFNPALLAAKPNKSNFKKKEIRYFTKSEANLITEECARKYSTGTPVNDAQGCGWFLWHKSGLLYLILGMKKAPISGGLSHSFGLI